MRRYVSCVCWWWEGSAKFKARENRKGRAKEPRRKGRLGREVSDGERNGVHRDVSHFFR